MSSGGFGRARLPYSFPSVLKVMHPRFPPEYSSLSRDAQEESLSSLWEEEQQQQLYFRALIPL